MKKLVKLAIIRKEDEDPCPYGLPITFGCMNAGDVIDKMAPLDAMGPDTTSEERAAITQANMHLLKWMSPGVKCKYAAKIIENKASVECNFREGTAGEGVSALEGSEWYPKQIGNSVGLGFPRGNYQDNLIDKSPVSGPYSLEGIASKDDNSEIKK